jgi:hypothetical protein
MYTALLPLIHDPEKELDSASDYTTGSHGNAYPGGYCFRIHF